MTSLTLGFYNYHIKRWHLIQIQTQTTTTVIFAITFFKRYSFFIFSMDEGERKLASVHIAFDQKFLVNFFPFPEII